LVGLCKCPGRNTSVLAVKIGNNKIIYKNILTAIADATLDLSMPAINSGLGTATAVDPDNTAHRFKHACKAVCGPIAM